MVETLRAANVARAENAQEAQAWEEEQARLRLLLDSVERKKARLEARVAERRAAIAELSSKDEALGPQGERVRALEALLEREADRIHAALDALDAAAMPGAILPKKDAIGPVNRFRAALERLEGAERGAEAVGVELVSGSFDGQPRSVELLRVGGAVGWWCGLDGAEAGTAAMQDGELRLTALSDDSKRDAVLDACRIAKGRAAPKLVGLPVGHARWTPEAER